MLGLNGKVISGSTVRVTSCLQCGLSHRSHKAISVVIGWLAHRADPMVAGKPYGIPREAKFLLERLYGPTWTKEQPGSKPSMSGLTQHTNAGWEVHPDVWGRVRGNHGEL